MKEYYIWESRCPDNHFWDTNQREQIIVAATCLIEAKEILATNNMATENFLFVGTRPITNEEIDYLDFVKYTRPFFEDKTDKAYFEKVHMYREYPYLPQCQIEAYSQPFVVIRRVTNCPLVA
jgi:hypothetical protein